MVWSHHSHSGQFCRHAKGSLRQVVETAYERGFKIYGLSEHMPRFRQQDLYPEESDMTVEGLEDVFAAYVEEAILLKEEYASKMTLLVGLETDLIHPASLAELKYVLEKYRSSLDYVVGSVHHCREIPIDFDQPTFETCLVAFEHDLQAYFQTYFDNQYALLQAIQPEVVGHFDLCRLYLPDATFNSMTWEKVQRNVQYAIDYGALFEVNAAAFRKGWSSAYPAPDVLQLITGLGGRFCLSDDSHGPHAVALHYADAYKYLRQQDINQIYYLCPVTDADEGTRESGRRRTRVCQVDGNWWEQTCDPAR